MEARLLLGQETRRDGGYNVFWGFGELGEASTSETAARECSEETLRSIQKVVLFCA